MTHHPDFPQILSLITKAASIFTLVVFFFVLQYLFDLDFHCSCNKDLSFMFMFMFIPPLLFTFITILIQNYYQKTMFRCQSHYFRWNIVGSFILRFFIIYVTLAAVWTTPLLFDGDLYFCLMTSFNESQTQLPCKTNLTSEETLIKNKYYTESLVIGFYVIGGLLLFWNFVKCCRPGCKPGKRNCCRACCKPGEMNCCVKKDQLYLPYYREVYEDLLSEEMNNHLKEELKRIAKKKVKAICNDCITSIEQDELKNDNDNPEADVEDPWQKISTSHFYLTENWPRQPASPGSSGQGGDSHGSSGQGGDSHGSSGQGGDSHGSSGQGGDSHGSSGQGGDSHGSSGQGGDTHGSSGQGGDSHGSSGQGGDSHGSSDTQEDSPSSSSPLLTRDV